MDKNSIDSRLSSKPKEQPPKWLELKCLVYIVFLSREMRRFFNKYGAPVTPDLKSNWFSIYCTEMKGRQYCKVTIASYNNDKCTEAAAILIREVEYYTTYHRILPSRLCTIYYHIDHTRFDCKRCRRCTRNHLTKNCPRFGRTIINQSHRILSLRNTRRRMEQLVAYRDKEMS